MNASTLSIARPARLRAPRGGLVFGGVYYRGGSYLPAAARPDLEALADRVAAVSVAEPIEMTIRGSSYLVRSILIDPSVGTDAFEMVPAARLSEAYHVCHDESGEVTCTCGDFTFRKAGTGEPCKHGRALVELGLIAPTQPAAESDALVISAEPTEEERIEATSYQIGMKGDCPTFRATYPDLAAAVELEDRTWLAEAHYRGVVAGLNVHARSLGYQDGLARKIPAAHDWCGDETYRTAYRTGYLNGKADRLDREAIMAGWSTDPDWHDAEVAECGAGSRLLPATANYLS